MLIKFYKYWNISKLQHSSMSSSFTLVFYQEKVFLLSSSLIFVLKSVKLHNYLLIHRLLYQLEKLKPQIDCLVN